MRMAQGAMPTRIVAGTAALMLGISGCRLMPVNQRPAANDLVLPAAKSSMLVVITSQDSPQALRITRALVTASARAGERILILGDRGGAALASSVAPAPPSARVPGPPVPLPPDQTSFQKSRYAQAVRHYQDMVRRARAALRRRQQEQLESWARSVLAQTNARVLQHGAGNDSISAALGAAVANISSLRQAGLDYGASKAIAIIGLDGATARSVPRVPAGLQDSTLVVCNFPGGSHDEAAWQASLLQDGAARAVLLTPTTDDQFESIVRQGLDGAVTDTLTSVLFALGQYALQQSALPQMRHLLRLLTVGFPQASVTINGYTDDLPTPGGNPELSLRRAQAVEGWLIAHGVSADRLQAVGYGSADPVAPNTPAGQSLNRRVVVVIDPTVPV